MDITSPFFVVSLIVVIFAAGILFGATSKEVGPIETGTSRTRAQGRASHGRESARQRGHFASRLADAGLPQLCGRRSLGWGARHWRCACARSILARCGETEQ